MEFMICKRYYWLDDPRHKEDAFIHFQGLAYANDSLPKHMVKDRNAEIMCGIMKRSGIGTYKDLQEAIGWFGTAARDGYADAQYYLGQMYEYGEGAAVDHENAYKWYSKAAERGMPENLQFAGGDPARCRYHLDRKENWWLVVPESNR